MDVGRIVYITVLVAFAVGLVFYCIFGDHEEPKKPAPPDIDLSDVPDFFDDEETAKAKRKRMHERLYYGGGE